MSIEKFKDITIRGHEFRIGLVTANVGLWIYSQMAAGRSSDEGVYEKIKAHLLNLCSVYKLAPNGERIPMKIYSDGHWLVPDLNLDYDLEAVYQLYKEALSFNFDPFLERRVAEAEKEKLRRAATSDTLQ